MTDESALFKARSKGAQAEALLRNELLIEAFDTLEAEYTKALFLTRPEAAQARESLYLAVNVVRKTRDHLNNVVTNGKLAQRELEELAGRKKRLGFI